MFEAVQNPIAYFFAMIVVLSVASLPPSPLTLMAAKANPAWLLASLAAVAAIAAVADYYLVRRVFRIGTLDRVRHHWVFERAERWASVAPFFTVALFAAIPLPFMIPRVLVPVSGYPVGRYAAAVALGRWPRIFVIAAFGEYVDVPPWMLKAFFVAGAVAALAGALVRRLRRPVATSGPPDPPPPAA